MRRTAVLLVLLVGSAALGQLRPAGPRRWLLTLSQNSGSSSDEKLRFANSDAKAFVRTMQEVGGVAGGDTVALYDATAGQARQAMGELRGRLQREASSADQLFVYVSSHADEGELRLGESRLRLAELHAFVGEAPVGVGFLIVDSCRSGAVTRLKGLRPAEGVSVRVESAEISGRVFISASGPDEYAQESEELGGSYFTHHWVAGLRGAADASRDGQVTLEEAYAYSYARTLESTFGSRGGLQRPSYHVDLRGHGDLVLAEVGQGKSRLALEVEPSGQWQVASVDGGDFVAHMEKARGFAELVVPPGDYRVRTLADDGYLERTYRVTYGGRTTVRMADLSFTPAPRVAMKGTPLTVTASLGGGVANGLVAGLRAVGGADLSVHLAGPRWAGPLNTLSFSFGYRRGEGTGTVHFLQQELELRAGLGRTLERGRWSLVLGPELGGLLVLQGRLPGGDSRVGLEPYAGAAAEGRVHLGDRVGLFASLLGGVVAVRKEGGVSGAPRVGGLVGVSVRL